MSRRRSPPEQLTRPRAPGTALAALCALALLVAPRAARAYGVWAAGPMAKFRRDLPPPSGLPSSVSISAARNEFEPFQIVLTGPIAGVSATASALTGPGGTIGTGNITLYREEYIQVTTASSSDSESSTGWWPDALVPAVDDVYREPRNAFPFSIPSGDASNQTRAIWVDVFVPKNTAPGDYSGSVTVTFNAGGAPVTVNVPVALHVWNFTLDATSHLRSAHFHMWGTLQQQHGSAYGTDLIEAYMQLALDHRISLSSIDDGTNTGTNFINTYGPQFLFGNAPSGTARQPPRLAGATLTTVNVVNKYSQSAIQEWWNAFNGAGLGDLLYVNCDEPQTPIEHLGDCINWFTWSHAVSGSLLRNHVTTDIEWWTSQGVSTSLVDIFDPVIDHVWPSSSGTDMSSYAGWLSGSSRRQVWDYQSCDSWGCSFGGGHGWPTNAIDANPERNRAEPWLSYQLGTRGELYWADLFAYYEYDQSNPWDSQWSTDWSGGNGDGNLFYPGTTARIGGTHDTPVPSIRLKMLREGMEDYEYLLMDAAKFSPSHAAHIAAGVFPYAQSTDNQTSPPLNQVIMNARAQLGREIDGGTADFTMAASPSSVTMPSGGTGTSTLTVSPTNGFTGTVTLTTSAPPSGASISVSPTTITNSGTATLTLNAGTAAAGTYAVTVTGTSGSLTHQTSVAWSISAAPDFTIAASPASVSTTQGSSGSSTVTVSSLNGFTGTVSLSASGAPSGASASVSPSSVVGSGSATLSLASGTAAAGTYSVTVRGTSGSLSHATSVTWTITSASTGNSGSLVWTRQWGTGGNDFGFGLAIDAGGNLYLTGGAGGLLTNGYYAGQDAFAAKLDANGNHVWGGQLQDGGDSQGRAIALDASGNVFVTGSTTDGLWTGYFGGAHDAFLARWNANTNGSEIWSQNIGTSGDDLGYGIAVDGSSNVYVAGATSGAFSGSSAGGYDAFLAKYRNNGSELWRRQFGTSQDDQAYSVAVDPGGNVLVAGGTSGNLAGTGNLGQHDFFVAKFDPSGNQLWLVQLGSAGDDVAYGVATDGSGNVYVAGATTGGYGFAPQGGADAFVDKLGPNGQSLWRGRLLGSAADDYAWRVAVDGGGNAYVTGGTLGDQGGLPNAGSWDVFLARYDASGNRQWVREFGGSGDDQATDVKLGPSNLLYLVGRTSAAMPGNASSGGYDIFFSKFQ